MTETINLGPETSPCEAKLDVERILVLMKSLNDTGWATISVCVSIFSGNVVVEIVYFHSLTFLEKIDFPDELVKVIQPNYQCQTNDRLHQDQSSYFLWSVANFNLDKVSFDNFDSLGNLSTFSSKNSHQNTSEISRGFKKTC